MSGIRNKEPEYLGSIIGKIIRETGMEDSILELELPSVWQEIVGEKIAAVTKVQSYEKGRLVVETDSSTWRAELLMRREMFVRLINERYSRNVVRELVIR